MTDTEPQPAEPLMTPRDLAAYLGGGITDAALRQWRHRGYGPAWIRVGRGVRYRREAVETWLRERERGQVPA